ncbi:universal stress protein [Halogeometricum luteum]|uniref:universal stress protein n=1 Tax=Halogeometricum luteum TaxID=2950537 RepID=UPI003CCD9F9F
MISEGSIGDDGATPLSETAERLDAAGIAATTRVAEDASPLEALLDAVPDHDAIVMGEQAPSLRSFPFGDVTERVAAESVGPVLVVRRPRSELGSQSG